MGGAYSGAHGAQPPRGQVVLITGCSEHGMGFHFAVEYAARGARVFATSRTTASMGALGKLPGITTLALDVTKREDVDRVLADIIAQAGRIDVLFNNAGVLVGPYASVMDMKAPDMRATLEVNFWGTVNMVQAVGPHMVAAGSGHIINNGSTASLLGVPYGSAYCASKWAAEGFTHSLRGELRPFGVKVTYLAPGIVRSRLVRPSNWDVPESASPFEQHARAYSVALKRAEQRGAMATDAFAAAVVSALAVPNPPAVWVGGGGAKAAYWLSWLLPPAVLDKVLEVGLGIKLPPTPAAGQAWIASRSCIPRDASVGATAAAGLS